jgi:hypothetical protein
VPPEEKQEGGLEAKIKKERRPKTGLKTLSLTFSLDL